MARPDRRAAFELGMQSEPEPEPEPEPPLRCRIDRDRDAMQAMHERHGWVPGAESIRPRPDVLEAKHLYQANTEQFYRSDVDCVLDLVFDCPTKSAACLPACVPGAPACRRSVTAGCIPRLLIWLVAACAPDSERMQLRLVCASAKAE